MMDTHKNFFCIALSVLMLTGCIFVSSPLFSEEIKISSVGPGTLSGRRVFPDDILLSKQEKDRTKEDAKLKLGIVLMWDYDQFNGVHMGRVLNEYRLGNEIELRRARIDLESKIDKDWHAELEVSFDSDTSTIEVEDAFIAFTGWNEFILTVGQAKEPFGLEEQTSSKHLTFIEQSMATSAFAPGCHPGLILSGHRSSFTWAIGVYEAADREKERDTYVLTGRLTFTPWNDKNHVLHIGIAGSGRDFGGEAYEIEERAEVHSAEKIMRSIEIPADDVRLLGLEFAWVKGPFSVQAEYMTAAIKAAIGKDAAYAGYYFQGSYFLTGESRPYKTGTFKGIKPISPYGALELVSRYSFLDVEDHKRGVSAANLTVGVNYYLNERVRLMTNYIETNLTDGVSGEKGNAEAISLRMQYGI